MTDKQDFPPLMPRLLKIVEVAAILQISKTSAYRLAASGQLPAVRFAGATVRVRPGDLEEFIRSNLVEGRKVGG